MEISKEGTQPKKLSKLLFNNFVVHLRPKIKIASLFVIRELSRKVTDYKAKKIIKEEVKQKNERKVARCLEQIEAIKSFHHHDIAKFVVLVTKPFEEVINNQDLTIEEIALTRVAYNKTLRPVIEHFRVEYPKWEKEILSFIKSLGIKYRKCRLKHHIADGRLEKLLEREKKFLQLLHDALGVELDQKLLKSMNKDKESKNVEGVIGKKQGLDVKLEGKKTEKGKKGKVKEVKKCEEEESDEESDVSLNKSFIKHNTSASESNTPVEVTSLFQNVEDIEDEEEDDESENEEEEDESENEEEEDESENEEEEEDESESEEEEDSDVEIKAKENIKKKNISKEQITGSSKISAPQRRKLLKVLKSAEKKDQKKSTNNDLLSNESDIIKKQNKGTSKVKLLDLNKEEENDSEVEHEDASSEEDEEFLKEDKMTSKRKKTNFFLGRDGEDEESDDDDDDDEAEEESNLKGKTKSNQIKRKRNEDDDDDDDDFSEYDTGKFFKKKVFRGDDAGRGGFRGRGRGGREDRGGFRGRGRGDRGGFRGRGRGGREDRGGFRGRGDSRGSRGGRGGFQGFDKRRDASEDGSMNRSREGFSPRGRGGFGGRGGNRGGFGDRDRSRGGFGGRGRGGGFGDRGRGGFGGRGRGGDRGRGGFGGRGGDRGGFGGRGRGRNADISSSNHMPLGERKSTNSGSSMLHPSWAAKKNQSGSAANFQGKKIVFDD